MELTTKKRLLAAHLPNILTKGIAVANRLFEFDERGVRIRQLRREMGSAVARTGVLDALNSWLQKLLDRPKNNVLYCLQ